MHHRGRFEFSTRWEQKRVMEQKKPGAHMYQSVGNTATRIQYPTPSSPSPGANQNELRTLA
jgi:hypothetical protein